MEPGDLQEPGARINSAKESGTCFDWWSGLKDENVRRVSARHRRAAFHFTHDAATFGVDEHNPTRRRARSARRLAIHQPADPTAASVSHRVAEGVNV